MPNECLLDKMTTPSKNHKFGSSKKKENLENEAFIILKNSYREKEIA